MERIALFAAAALMLLGCIAQNKQENTNTIKHSNNQEMNKIVIFFSHAGDNYSVGVIDTGNTKIVADYISEITDEFSIYGHEVRSGKAKVEKWLKGLR